MINPIGFRGLTTQVPPQGDEKYVKKPNALEETAKDEAVKVVKKAAEKVPTQYGAIEQGKKLDIIA